MALSYLDSNGLLYFWQKIKANFVAKVAGKDLSTNDYTTAEKTKLAGIATGANAYSLPTASTDTLGGVKVGSGLAITSGVLSATGGGTADAVDWANVTNAPTKLSSFTNDSGFITNTASITGNAATATKLAATKTIGVSGITGTAQAFDGSANITIPITAVPATLLTGTASIATTGNAATATKATQDGSGNVITTTYATKASIPTKLSSFTNDSGYQTQAQVNSLISTALTSAVVYKGSVDNMTALNALTGMQTGWMYNVSASDMNYVWNGTYWDPQGSTFTITSTTNSEIDMIVAQ